jgi:soluble P-type ATPase
MRKIIIGSSAVFFATTFLVFVSTAARANDVYAVTFERDAVVVMRDGTKLYADVFRPDAAGKFPILLQRTPYDKNYGTEFGLKADAQGYVVIIEDVRGRYASEGEWYPFKNEMNDGYDTVEWAAARVRKLVLEKAEGFESIAGIGVRGNVGGRQLKLGSYALMAQKGGPVDETKSQAEALRAEGASVMYLSIDGILAGVVAVSDPIKANAVDALATLKAAGLHIIMASGDGLTTARAVAAKLGIDEVYGEINPADKLALVERLQREGHIVAMAGDGINDAPALAKADVGVAMGTGTDVAMKSAPVTLVKGDLRGIVEARRISNETVANMKQNLGFAFLYNCLGVPLAAGVLYPLTGWLLSPMIAALAMSLSSVSVITNALRLGRAHHG